MKKIAVLGSAGFIAGYVIEELHKQGHYVIGMQRHMSNSVIKADIFDSQKADEIYLGDIAENPEVVSRVISISDGVINLAGRLGTSEEVNDPEPAVKVNIIGTLNMLKACRTWKRPFVQIAVGNHWMDNTYSITRTTAERFCKMYVNEHGVEGNVVRALNAYGPRQSHFSYKKIIPSFVLAALRNEPLMVNGDGSQRMDMIYVADLAKFLVDTLLRPTEVNAMTNCLLAAMGVGQALNNAFNSEKVDFPLDQLHKDIGIKPFGNVYQCGEGEAATVTEIAELIVKLTKSKSEIKYKEMRAGEPVGSVIMSDYESPAYKVKLEEGLKKTIAYYKKNLNRYVDVK